MRFVVGKKYKFSNHHSLRPELKGNYFTPQVIDDGYMKIHVYNSIGDRIYPTSSGFPDYWQANPSTDLVWENYLDASYYENTWGKSKLEFKFV